MAAVNPQSVGERLRDLIPRLREADEKLTAALERMEDLFELHLPEDAYGRILVQRPRAPGGEWVHVVYEEGVLWIERWSNKGGFRYQDLTKWDVREHKIEVCRRVADLWTACGGGILSATQVRHEPGTAPTAKVVK
jgi:hypothetical protein